jgi:CBS domain-containing protein
MLKNQKVEDIMTENVITVLPTEDVVFAFEKLMKYKVSALPVVDDGNLIGIVTATDLGHNLILDKYELGTSVAEVMVKDVICVKPGDNLYTAVKKMNEYGGEEGIVNQLVVIDNHKIKGIITDGDVIRAII